ncbi:MAG: serine/threonine-protein phosphatase, partial [Verrucomicrobia bacterium]|nr:serine/threonine-protein phosphatase [Cytophagales bacterium]
SRFFFCIADASGKGISAALLMSNFQAALRVLIRQTTDLKQIVRELNYLIYCNTEGERFITFFGALYDSSQKTLTYINSGHNPPVFADENGTCKLLDKGTPILGVLHPLPFVHETVFENADKFMIFAYTDGLTETCNAEDEEFSSEKVFAIIDQNKALNLNALHEELMQQLNDFCQGNTYVDDVTLFSCKVL